MAAKRVFNLSPGDMPGKPKNKVPTHQPHSRKSLFQSEEVKQAEPARQEKPIPWSEKETKALVQYVCLFWKDAWKNKWPSTKDQNFWKECAKAVNKAYCSSRTGVSCRTRVLKHLAKKFPTLSDAEEAFNIDYVVHSDENVGGISPRMPFSSLVINDSLSPIFKTSSAKSSLPSRSVGDIVQDFITAFKCTMSQRLKEQLVHYLYKLMVIELGGMPLYKFVEADFLDKLGIEDHYVQWLETMFAHFGHKWMCLHRGPAWQYEVKVEAQELSTECEPMLSNILENALEFSGISFLSDDMENINTEPQIAHCSNTVIEHSCKASPIITELFNVLEALYVFYTGSTKRMSSLEDSIQSMKVDDPLNLRNLSRTRWTARAESIKSVWICYEAILDSLSNLEQSDDGTASGLRSKLLRFDCIMSIMFMKNMMPVKGILTCEVVVGLVANLESRHLRRIENAQRGLQPEHPRSSSTDDVEGFISLLHEMLGPIFDIKQFYSEQPKILNQFKKRIDSDLGFFYSTGAKTRYNDYELPSFNEPSGPGLVERSDNVQLSRGGDPGVFVGNRPSPPQKGQLTARAKFHRAPIALPPLPLT
ncbi:Transposon Tf2-6 poly [Paramuricea clavata]|uniref:Transposon Tf2-6 poly n=1 Tax=Paramuricea clavata TaxID=317549 RepID=A0A6S7H2S7_PARCT|nr:Transposon Tf2-6 poly [Paramuricea clavata]